MHSFYQARKRLRTLGLLPPARSRRSPKKAARQQVSFSKVELTPPSPSPAAFRLGLPNGLTLEWSGSELPSPVVELLERLIQPR
jgi:hypothetical protein